MKTIIKMLTKILDKWIGKLFHLLEKIFMFIIIAISWTAFVIIPVYFLHPMCSCGAAVLGLMMYFDNTNSSSAANCCC